MAKKTKAQLQTDINSAINANGTQAITGPVLNQILIDITDSVPVIQVEAEYRKEVSINISNEITFPTAFGTDIAYALNVRCYDSLDSPIEFEIVETAIDNFKITVVRNGFIDYSAIEDL